MSTPYHSDIDDSEIVCRCGANLTQLRVFPHEHRDTCPMEACDDPQCRAPKAPTTTEEWRAARDHWKTHRLLGGCSHSR